MSTSSVEILDQTKVAVLVSKVIDGSKSLVADIHQASVSILDHIREHGNYTEALRLLNGMHTGVRVKALAEWFKGFSNGKFAPGLNPKTKQWQAELSKDRTDNDFDIEGASLTTFAEFTVERDPVTLTVDKFIRGLRRTASNTGVFPNTSVPKVSDDTRALAMKIVQFLQTEVKKGLAA